MGAGAVVELTGQRAAQGEPGAGGGCLYGGFELGSADGVENDVDSVRRGGAQLCDEVRGS